MTSTGSLLLPAAFITTMLASIFRLPLLKGGPPQRYLRPLLVGDTHYRGASTSLKPSPSENGFASHLYGKTLITSHDKAILQKLEESAIPLSKFSLPPSFQQLAHNLRPLPVRDELALTNDVKAAYSLFKLPQKIEELRIEIKNMQNIIENMHGSASDTAKLTLGQVYSKLAYYQGKLDSEYKRSEDETYCAIRVERNTTAQKIDFRPCLQLIKKNKLDPVSFEFVYEASLKEGKMLSELEHLMPMLYDAFDPTYVLRARAQTSYGALPGLDTLSKFADWLKAVREVCGRGCDQGLEDQQLLEKWVSEGTRLGTEFLRAARKEEKQFKREKKLRKERVDAQVERDIERLKKSENWLEIEKLFTLPCKDF